MLAAAIGVAAPAFADTGQADLTDYIKARAADADGQVAAAAASYAQALSAAPGNQVVAIRAYREALAAGDYDLAVRASQVLQASGVAPADSALLSLADAVHQGDKRAAGAAIDRLGSGPLAFLAPILRGWQAFDQGVADPLAPLDAVGENPLGRRYAAENRALLLIAIGKTNDGVAALRATLGADQGSFDLRINAAQLLTAKGKKDIAAALLSGSDPVLATLRADLGDGVRPSFAFGVSRLFSRLAADLAHSEPTPLSIVLTRAALRAEPGNDRARLVLAEALAGDDATEGALATLDQIDAHSPFRAVARSARVTVLDHAGDQAGALAAAKALAEADGATSEDAQLYGDQLIDADDYAGAARAYGMAIERAGEATDWTMYLQRGGALDQSGDWAAARPVLEKALALAPNEPLALNYLGYADLEHGENVSAARAMLEKASSLKPDDPSITDSLAWAYFKQGETAKALPLLERAAKGQPGDVEINEHLGDAYWTAGRYYEARYAWRAASVYADPPAGTRLASKIANGLGAGAAQN